MPLDKKLESGSGRGKNILPESHWFNIVEKLYKESGEIPDPLQIRAYAILDALDIPFGQISALEVNQEGKRINPEKDKIIAKYLTNKAGVIIDKKTGIVSSDFRDMYPHGLPQELKNVLSADTLAIMKAEYQQAKSVKERFGDTENDNELDCTVRYFRLTGGIDLFLRGYFHSKKWQENHKKFLQKANQHASVICIEGFSYKPFGSSLDLMWSDLYEQRGDYDALMHEAVDAGFNGLFTEIDARDTSKISMDHIYGDFPNLLFAFFTTFFSFLQKEHPTLAEKIKSPENLKQILISQSTTNEGIVSEIREKKASAIHQGRYYWNHPYISKTGEVSLEPTFLEFGQFIFSDALAAIKLQLIAKLMRDGHIKKGPIIDYEGALHISSKSFFLQYPQYAMEIVLRTVNELMAGKVKEIGNIEEIYSVFKNPDWAEIVKEISRVVFKKPEDDLSKTTALGPDQHKLLDVPINFLEIYNIDPYNVVPSREEIEKIQGKLAK